MRRDFEKLSGRCQIRDSWMRARSVGLTRQTFKVIPTWPDSAES